MNRIMIISLAGIILSSAGGLVINIMPAKLPKMAGILTFYLGGSILLLNVCSFQMCAALFACGIGVTVLLGTGFRDPVPEAHPKVHIGPVLIFRFVLSVILGVLAYSITDQIRLWLPVRRTVLFISIWVILSDLISLSIDDDLLFRWFYLQSICLSFTLSYIYMESSVLVFACFAVINLLLAFGGAVLTGRRGGPAEFRTEEQG